MATTEAQRKARAKKIEEWVGKGAEWCATKLWESRQIARETRAQFNSMRNEIFSEGTKVDMLKEVNRNMASVLGDAGIPVTPITVSYLERNCEKCEYWYGEDEGCMFYGECVGPTKRTVETLKMYDLKATEDEIAGRLEGISTQFRDVDIDMVISVTDSRTGEELWSFNAEEVEK